MLAPYLTEDELAEICAPLRQGAAQVKLLQSWGIRVRVKPNGRPLVWRSDLERAQPAPTPTRDTVPASNEPNWTRRTP